jgi:multidrug efflux pump subunit AcrA (membrane-fusion protein)
MHQPIITLPDMSEMQVTLRVHEMDIGKISKGMAVSVTVEAAGSKCCAGKITKIAELANAGNWRSDPEVKQFDVEVTLDGRDLGLKPGTTAEVEIVLHRLKGVLVVPIKAVRGIGPKTFCYVEEAGRLCRRDVEIGLSNDKFVEIRSGLSAGEKVLVDSPPADLVRGEESERERIAAEKRGGAPAGGVEGGAERRP